MAVDVLEILLKKHPDAELCMVGPDKDGSMQKTINLAKRYGIDSHLKVTGQMTKSEWNRLSDDYDIFISTTNFDNTPVSVIEAMALGLPVISTNVGGVPYLVKNGVDALLVEKGNAKEMADKIENLLTNFKMAHAISRNARVKAESFGWENVKKQWQSLLI